MQRGTIRKLGAVATAAALTGLMAISSGDAAASSSPPGPHQLRVAITNQDMYLDGSTTIPAGRLHLTLENAKQKGDATVEVVRFAIGYSFADYRHDLKIAFANLFGPNGDTKKGLKHLNHAIHHTTFYGGFQAPNGKTKHGTLLLTDLGDRYWIYDDSGSLPRRQHELTVTAPTGPQTLPTTAATVVAKTNRRFGGDTNLPAKGDITFKNESTESPHFLDLQQVKHGTTRKQVRQALQSNDPSIFRAGSAAADVVSLDQQMTLHVNVPPGRYAELCFFPDPKTGMPHAFMGMIRIVHLS